MPLPQPAATKITPCAHAKYLHNQTALQGHSSTFKHLIPGIFPSLAERPLPAGLRETILPPRLSTTESSGALGPVLGSTVQKGHGANAVKNHEDGYMDWSIYHTRRGQELSLKTKRFSGDLIKSIKI